MTTRAAAIIEVIRVALGSLDELAPAEQDHIIGALVADLRTRRPVAVAPLSRLPAAEGPNVDPRGDRS